MVIVDLETSGLNPQKNSIISIGAVNFFKPDQTFYGECRIRSGSLIDEKSLIIAGFTAEQCQDTQKQSESDLIKKFLNWLTEQENQTIAGQNPHFDLSFLNMARKASKIEFVFGFRTVDLHSVAFAKYLEVDIEIPLRNQRTDINLDTILEFCGLPERVGSHNALEDSLLEAECFSRIIYGENLIEKFNTFEIPNHLKRK
jgi:DNA polymerase III epsilon subunit-like protein